MNSLFMTKSNFLFGLVVFLLIISSILTYYRTMVIRDYPIINSSGLEE